MSAISVSPVLPVLPMHPVLKDISGGETPPFPFLPDVQITNGSVPLDLKNMSAEGVLWQAAPGQFLLRVPAVASFLVEAGRSITIDPEPHSTAAEIRRFLRMTPLAALLYQRGTLAFHAAAAANSEGAILLAGDSGAGKSTLLMALLNRGWTMLSDEVAFVVNGPKAGGQTADAQNDSLCVPPTFPELRVWDNTNSASAQDEKTAPAFASQVCSTDTSHWRTLSMTREFSRTFRPLRAVFHLMVHHDERVELRELQGMDRFRGVGTLAYNSHIADALLDRVAYMRVATQLAQTVPILRLRRPRGKRSVEELADQVEVICGAPIREACCSPIAERVAP